MNPTLVILAAGMGSRYGGLKQLDTLGPNGESIIDYSIFDARRMGFGRIVFVIKEEHLPDFQARFAYLEEAQVPVSYAFQSMDDLPQGFSCPQGRTKPWGTGHAVYCARHVLEGPFGVIGADDFYGRETFDKLHDFLSGGCDGQHLGMVVHRLKNTLPSQGAVSRGVCRVAADGTLAAIDERTRIFRQPHGQIVYEEAGQTHPLDPDSAVSMLVWGMHSDIFPAMAQDFAAFLADGQGDPLKREYYMPSFVSRYIGQGNANMRVLETSAQWFGVTYQEDRQSVVDALGAMHAQGIYPTVRPRP